MLSSRPYSTIFFARPAEFRNPCASNLPPRLRMVEAYSPGVLGDVHNCTSTPAALICPMPPMACHHRAHGEQRHGDEDADGAAELHSSQYSEHDGDWVQVNVPSDQARVDHVVFHHAKHDEEP